MKNQIDQMQQKLDGVLVHMEETNRHLSKIDIHLAKYNAELEFHVARTTQLENELSPVVKHVHQMRGAAALLAIIGTLVGIFAALWSMKGN